MDCIDPCDHHMYSPSCVDGHWVCNASDQCGECEPVGAMDCVDPCDGTMYLPSCIDGAWICERGDACPGQCAAEWSLGWGTDGWDQADGVALGPNDEVLVAAYFRDTLTFGTDQLTSAGDADVLLLWLDADGELLQARSFGGPERDEYAGLAVDGAGNAVLAIEFDGVADFGFGSVDAANGGTVLLKLSPTGALVWGKQLAMGVFSDAEGVAVDPQGNVVLAGSVSGPLDFGGAVLSCPDDQRIFVAKLDPDGDHIWSTCFGGPSYEYVYGVSSNAAFGVVVTGTFRESIDIGGQVLTSAGGYDAFVAAFDADGVFRYSHRIGGSGDDAGADIVGVGYGGAYVVGAFSDTVDLGGGPVTAQNELDAFVVRYTPSGEYQWGSALVGASEETFGSELWSVATRPNGDVVVGGHFTGVTDATGELRSSAGSYDLVTTVRDMNGQQIWGCTDGGYNTDQIRDVAVTFEGEVVIVGTQWSGSQFDLGDGPHDATAQGDSFVAKLLPPDAADSR
jgi:hypothetical protein